MALPSSGTLTMADIAGEFGGSVPHSLSEYYRGGSLVPDTSLTASIPTSGLIKLSDFYGTQAAWGATITSERFVSDDGGDPPVDIFDYGYYPVQSSGSISDTTVDTLSNATVVEFRHESPLTDAEPDDNQSYSFSLQGSIAQNAISSFIVTPPGESYTFNVPASGSGINIGRIFGESNQTFFFFYFQSSGNTFWRFIGQSNQSGNIVYPFGQPTSGSVSVGIVITT